MLVHQSLINNLLFFTLIALSSIFFLLVIVSLFEKEYRAAKISLFLSVFFLLLSFVFNFLSFPGNKSISFILLIIIYILIIILFVPLRKKVKVIFQTPTKKFDERDIMFSRNELKTGSEKYEKYYSNKEDIKRADEKFRNKPGLLSKNSNLFQRYSFASAHSNLEVIEILKPHINGKITERKTPVDALKISVYLKTWVTKLGVHSIGITKLKDYHLYSHKGRGELYGKEIKNTHDFAIAFTVEMDNEMIQSAPKGPVIMESTQQYLNSGVIALQIANFIRELGYSARAHIDGNYEVICPLVARDAGLGEIGRMGLLMTPKLGPRVRIAIVTTDLPLYTDSNNKYNSVIDFCTICKKCADVCPSQSISHNEREKIEGVFRWKINAESCFTYWCKVGTDCGRCIAVCPYSHPNNLLHNVIRWGINNSFIFRHFALYMDDLFYGRKPKSRNIPSWIDM